MVIPREDGLEVAYTMRLALADAGVTPAQVDYINAHATSTTIGDAVEARAIRQLFKSRTDKIAISATKSLIGHTLGAAGAIGGIASVLAIHTGHIHPTANYDQPDPACALGRTLPLGARTSGKGGLAECLWIWQQQRRCGIETRKRKT